MRRRTKIGIGCGTTLILLVIAAFVGFQWIIRHDDSGVVRNVVPTAYWHKKVNPHDMSQVRQFARKFGYNDDYYVVCDFGKPSGKKRFYIYDLNDGEKIDRSYCMHGYGAGSTAAKPRFSNKPGSKASSIGLYVLSGVGSWSIKNCIRLDGLDKTNYLARARGILIHSAGKVTRFHGEKDYIPLGGESAGCFVVSYPTLLRLMTIYKLHGRHKRILMWAER